MSDYGHDGVRIGAPSVSDTCPTCHREHNNYCSDSFHHRVIADSVSDYGHDGVRIGAPSVSDTCNLHPCDPGCDNRDGALICRHDGKEPTMSDNRIIEALGLPDTPEARALVALYEVAERWSRGKAQHRAHEGEWRRDCQTCTMLDATRAVTALLTKGDGVDAYPQPDDLPTDEQRMGAAAEWLDADSERGLS